MPSLSPSHLCAVHLVMKFLLLAVLLQFQGSLLWAQDGFHVDPVRSVEKQRLAARAAAQVAAAGGSKSVEVCKLLDDPSGVVRDRVFEIIDSDWSDEDLALLLVAASRGGPLALEALAEIFGRRQLVSSTEFLCRILQSRGPQGPREMAAWALGEMGTEASRKVLEKVVRREKSSFRVRCEALRSLARVAGSEATEAIEEALAETRMHPLPIAALQALETIDEESALRAALTLLQDPPSDRRGVWTSRIERAALAIIERQANSKRPLTLLRETIDLLVEKSVESRDLSRRRFLEVFETVTGVSDLPPKLEAWHGWWRARRELWNPPAGGEGDARSPRQKPKREGTRVVRLHGVPLDSARVLILQDVSGGMSRTIDGSFDGSGPTRLEISRGELDRLLRSLDGSAWVQVVYFASRAVSASEVPQQLARARGRLLEFNSRQKVPTGHGLARGNIHDPLAQALLAPHVDTVYLLTEGAPTEGKYHDFDRLRHHIERLNRLGQVRIHVLLVGATSGKNRQFLEALALATGGELHDVSEGPAVGD